MKTEKIRVLTHHGSPGLRLETVDEDVRLDEQESIDGVGQEAWMHTRPRRAGRRKPSDFSTAVCRVVTERK